jgi:hypothetical protein
MKYRVCELVLLHTSFAFGRPFVFSFAVCGSIAIFALPVVPFFAAIVNVALAVVVDDEVVLV